MAMPLARIEGRRALRLLALAAVAGFLAYLLPLCDALLAAPAHPLVRARGTPLARQLQAEHDPGAAGGGASFLAAHGLAPDPARLPPPALVEPGRPDKRDSSRGPSDPGHRPDLSRSPPGR
jgi:hypothetical protein